MVVNKKSMVAMYWHEVLSTSDKPDLQEMPNLTVIDVKPTYV